MHRLRNPGADGGVVGRNSHAASLGHFRYETVSYRNSLPSSCRYLPFPSPFPCSPLALPLPPWPFFRPPARFFRSPPRCCAHERPMARTGTRCHHGRDPGTPSGRLEMTKEPLP
ncbi:hypothetical protein STXM2123_1848 [Streptomyces sp. F-3]|nr:hypothetical protein STXM2123_1848 [Streptomyces sp. F-3]